MAPNTANTKQAKVLRNLRPTGIPVGNLHRAKCGVHRANLGKLHTVHRAKLEPETILTKKTIKKMIENKVVTKTIKKMMIQNKVVTMRQSWHCWQGYHCNHDNAM